MVEHTKAPKHYETVVYANNGAYRGTCSTPSDVKIEDNGVLIVFWQNTTIEVFNRERWEGVKLTPIYE